MGAAVAVLTGTGVGRVWAATTIIYHHSEIPCRQNDADTGRMNDQSRCGVCMSYQVLARKWRPRRFEDVVGQEHVLRALRNALDHDRLHHAYLFTGTRGTGKTTLARILAKCLNCEQGVGANPCGSCSACQSIDEGRFVDLIEVDAASRAKVDETRDLMDNVQYAPTAGRFKVYLIDEVHMFSGHSFNALLKTLEEPPPHVKFLLATTEPKRIPVTILSRCIQFNLKHLAPAQIEAQLEKILDAEGIQYEPAACRLLARAADGSLRDALSLMDQAIAFGNDSVAEAPVREMLGTLDTGALLDLLDLLADNDAAGILERAGKLAEHQHDYAAALAELAGYLFRIAVIQTVAMDPEDDLASERLQPLAERLEPEDVQLYYQIALQGRRDLAMTPDPRVGFEMTLVRMLAFRPDAVTAGAGQDGTNGSIARPAAARRASSSAIAGQTAVEAKPPAGRTSATVPPAQTARERPDTITAENWAMVVGELDISGLARQLASHCVPKSHDEHKIELMIAPAHAPLVVDTQKDRLQQALRDYYNTQLKLVISVEEHTQESPADALLREADERKRQAVQSVEQDPLVQAMLETFDAEIDHNSIQPKSN